jgi:hypothetical protein
LCAPQVLIEAYDKQQQMVNWVLPPMVGATRSSQGMH